MDSRDCNDGNKPAPSLEVDERLPNLIPFPLARLDAHLVCTQPFDSDDSLALAQIFGLHWRIRHEHQDYKSVRHSQQTTEQEDDLVLVHGIAVDVTQPIGKQTSNNEGDTVHRIPGGRAHRLFRPTPPHRGSSNAGWRDHRLEATEKETKSEQTLEVGTGCHDGKAATPAEDCSRDNLSCGKLDEQECRKWLHHQLGQIQDRAQP